MQFASIIKIISLSYSFKCFTPIFEVRESEERERDLQSWGWAILGIVEEDANADGEDEPKSSCNCLTLLVRDVRTTKRYMLLFKLLNSKNINDSKSRYRNTRSRQ
jgi:hypothetical protein